MELKAINFSKNHLFQNSNLQIDINSDINFNYYENNENLFFEKDFGKILEKPNKFLFFESSNNISDVNLVGSKSNEYNNSSIELDYFENNFSEVQYETLKNDNIYNKEIDEEKVFLTKNSDCFQNFSDDYYFDFSRNFEMENDYDYDNINFNETQKIDNIFFKETQKESVKKEKISKKKIKKIYSNKNVKTDEKENKNIYKNLIKKFCNFFKEKEFDNFFLSFFDNDKNLKRKISSNFYKQKNDITSLLKFRIMLHVCEKKSNEDNKNIEALKNCIVKFMKKISIRHILKGRMKNKKEYIEYKNKCFLPKMRQIETYTNHKFAI